MSIFSSRRRGTTLIELLVAMALLGVVMSLLYAAMVDVHRFYKKVSTQSRQVGSAVLFLDRVEALTYGLPKQALTLSSSPAGGLMLTVQPFSAVAASGAAVYSDRRWVLENSPKGVFLWDVQDESSDLGAPLAAFPPPSSRAHPSMILGPDWTFDARFQDDQFPLRITVTPPAGTPPMTRSIEGYL